MENSISQELGNLISKSLHLDLFWSITLSNNSVSIIGDYSKATENYLLKKSFEKKDYLYADEKNKIEFINGNIRILLIKK
jgi:hypothetical protein